MRKHLLTSFIILIAAILIAFGIVMPKITFSYQNDTLLSQVEKDQIDEVSFLDEYDNEALNALQMLSLNEFTVLSDERDSDISTKRQLKSSTTSFLETLTSYTMDYHEQYGYISGNSEDFFCSSPQFFVSTPCIITVNTVSDTDSSVLDYSTNSSVPDYSILFDSIPNTASSGSGSNNENVWDDRPAWIVSSDTPSNNLNQIFLFDDASGKIVSFLIYDEDYTVTPSLSLLDINEYIFIFTNLLTDYYKATILSIQRDYDVTLSDDSGSEKFNSFYLYFTISESSLSDTTITITILVGTYFVIFNWNC